MAIFCAAFAGRRCTISFTMKMQAKTRVTRPIERNGLAFTFCVLLLFGLSPRAVAAQTSQTKPTKRVLIFTEDSSPAVDLIESEIRSSLSEQTEYKVDLFDESLETS